MPESWILEFRVGIGVNTGGEHRSELWLLCWQMERRSDKQLVRVRMLGFQRLEPS